MNASNFQTVNEYFKLKRGTRVCTIAFTYHLGKTKGQTRRTTGASADEIDRVGNGN